MNKYDGIERRKYVRVPFSVVLRYKATQAAGGGAAPKFYMASVTKNISMGGILFPATMNVPMGTELDIELNLSAIPHEESKEALAKYRSVQVTGRVVRSEEIIKGELYNIGFMIDKIEDKDRKALQQFIEFFLKRERLRNKFKFGITGKEYIGPERRKFLRVPYTFIVKYSKGGMEHSKGEESRYCLNSNISACGVLLETHEKFEISQTMHLEVVLPNDKEVIPIKLAGRVVRTEELIQDELYETGVAFEDVAKKDQAALYEFLVHFLKTNKDSS
jgi:c-di-GMP-binding flagellar brake protein YcgR